MCLRRFPNVWRAALNCRSCNGEKRDESIGTRASDCSAESVISTVTDPELSRRMMTLGPIGNLRHQQRGERAHREP